MKTITPGEFIRARNFFKKYPIKYTNTPGTV